MNVLIIGAAGRTGELVVERALAAGHTVTALVRNPAAYHAPPTGRVVSGDATDPTRLADAMVGQDAVIDTVATKTPYRLTTLEADVAKAILTAMEPAGVRRLIVTSALGVGDSVAQAGLLYRLLMPMFLRGVIPGKTAMEDAVRQAGVDFVLARPPVLTDGPPTGSARPFTGRQTAHRITRADLAQFLVDQLQSDAHLGRAVTIANG